MKAFEFNKPPNLRPIRQLTSIADDIIKKSPSFLSSQKELLKSINHGFGNFITSSCGGGTVEHQIFGFGQLRVLLSQVSS